jgi:DNA-binding response OmpR family regulator
VARILIVDDDASIRALLRATLAPDEFDIVEVANGREALAEACGREQPDVIVLDWSMPEASGGDVLVGLRERDVSVPVIVLTAELAPRYEREAKRLGATTFLTKPFSPLQLLAEIERLVGRVNGG